MIMEHKRIKVRLTKNSPYSDYGYYEKGDIGYIDGYVNNSAVIILENGKFAKSDLGWIEVVNEEDDEQKPAWSEEDKAHIDSLLKRLEGMCKPDATFISTEFAISEDEDWLESLRHRLQWKPSDEQMKALEESIMFLGTSWVSTRQFALESLYQELKKLREE